MTLPISVVKRDDKEAVTFEEALHIVGTGSYQIKIAIIGGIVLLSSYFAVGVITFVLPSAHCDLQLDYTDRGNLASISFVGIIISCHMWGFLSDTLGRRYIIIRCLFFDAAIYALTAIVPNFYIIFTLRLLNGIASCGGVVSIYAYVGEFQTDKFRSRAIMISSFIAATAYLLLPALAWLIVPGKWQFELYPGLMFRSWRLFYILCGIPSLFSATLLLCLPESPKFLCAKGENKKVILILEKMYRVNHKKCDKPFPVSEIKMNIGERVGKLDDNKNKVLAVCQLLWNQTAPLLKRPHGFNFSLLSAALFICYFCNNGMYVWLPEAINRMELYKQFSGKEEGTFCEVIGCSTSHGIKESVLQRMLNASRTEINSMASKLLNIEEPVCNDEIDTSVFIDYILIGIIIIFMFVIITAVIKYVNKKYVLLLLSTLSLVAVILMKWSGLLMLIIIKAGSIMVFACGVFPILNSVVVDLFPTNLRAMAGCLTLMASRLGTVVTHEVTGLLIESHCEVLMWSYIILSTVSVLAIALLPSLPPRLSPTPAATPDIHNQERYYNHEEV